MLQALSIKNIIVSEIKRVNNIKTKKKGKKKRKILQRRSKTADQEVSEEGKTKSNNSIIDAL